MNAVKKILTPEQEATIARRKALEAELATLGKMPDGVSFKVNQFVDKKGETKVNVMIHGITARPIPLYASQALVFAQVAEQLAEFVEENRAVLSWKS